VTLHGQTTALSGVAEVFGGVLPLVGLLIAVAAAVFSGATRGVFGVALYRYVAEGQTVGPFTAPEMETAARRR
jgi:hypothetical protein